MGDSWDDEEFEIPTIAAAPVIAAVNWDDEEDNVVVDEDIVSKPSASQVAAQKKKAAEEELTFQTKMKLSLLENETPDQKKLRERRQLEEADAELSSELFTKTKKSTASSSTTGGGIGSIVLKTMGDHSTFGNTIAAKLKDSSAFNVGAFYKSLNKVLDKEISLEVIEEIYQTVSRIRDAKLKEKPANAPLVKKKSKKDLAKDKQAHDDKFGGSSKDYDDTYDNLEDDFM